MKTTISSFLAIFLFAGHAWSQSPERTAGHSFIEAPNHHNVRDAKSIPSSNRALISQWMNFIDLTSSYYSSTPDYDYYFLFPDTSAVAPYSSSFGIPFIHSFGMTFDLSSDVINAGMGSLGDQFNLTKDAYIDSIATYGRYVKGSAGYVDTLIYRVVPRGTNNLNVVGYFTGQSTKYPASNDTARYRRLYWDSVAREPFGVIAEFKVPLVLSDTLANGLIYPKVATGGLAVPSIFAVTIDYKPGGYIPFGDTLGNRIGSYTQVVAEHNGDGTYHNYIPGDYTGSSSVHRTVRYNYSSTGWNGRYIPYLAYGATQFEAVDIDLYVRQNTVGLTENKSITSLVQSYPNPANENVTIKFDLKNEAEVSVEVMDISGKVVHRKGSISGVFGENRLELDTYSWDAGTYFYTIIVNDEKVTKKMIVSH